MTLGALRAVSRFYDGLAVVQLDAHADLRPNISELPIHASVMNHIKRELAPEIFSSGYVPQRLKKLLLPARIPAFIPFRCCSRCRKPSL